MVNCYTSSILTSSQVLKKALTPSLTCKPKKIVVQLEKKKGEKMQTIVHKLDWYTKLVLTIIAVALMVMILKPVFVSKEVGASGKNSTQKKAIDVNLNIDKIGGQKILRWWEAERAEKGIPIYVEGKITTEKLQ